MWTQYQAEMACDDILLSWQQIQHTYEKNPHIHDKNTRQWQDSSVDSKQYSSIVVQVPDNTLWYLKCRRSFYERGFRLRKAISN